MDGQNARSIQNSAIIFHKQRAEDKDCWFRTSYLIELSTEGGADAIESG
jgi:hypothetical protein